MKLGKIGRPWLSGATNGRPINTARLGLKVIW